MEDIKEIEAQIRELELSKRQAQEKQWPTAASPLPDSKNLYTPSSLTIQREDLTDD